MSGASDKARYYLEQTVPELREWERRGVFSKQEIANIASRRSDFEHKLSARESVALDHAQYAMYEINIDRLCKKRIVRRAIKATGVSGARRILHIFDRGTRKFPGDTSLWLQYLKFLRQQGAQKRMSFVLTNALRVHPTNAEFWKYAALYHAEAQSDISTARFYFKRGVRLCAPSKSLYLAYARIEVEYISKISRRTNILGVNRRAQQDLGGEEEDIVRTIDNETPFDDMVSFDIGSKRHPETFQSNMNRVHAAEGSISDKILNGAIPKAIFDAAISHFPRDESYTASFIDMLESFDTFHGAVAVTEYIIDHPMAFIKSSVQQRSLSCRLPLCWTSPTSDEFPIALREALNRTSRALSADHETTVQLANAILSWLEPLQSNDNLVHELQEIVAVAIERLSQVAHSED